MLTSIQRDAKDAAAEHFRSTITAAAIGRNVVGWGIGTKVAEGTIIPGESTVRVYVQELDPNIPKQFGNLSVDVIKVGKITACENKGRYRPVPCGFSVGHPKITAGTLGCLVEKDGKHYILSNNHVLANSNAAREGDLIIQPGTSDNGKCPGDKIATLEPYSKIDFSGDNYIDAAIALVGDAGQTLVEPEIIGIGTPSSTPCLASIGQEVRKSGRTTGHTVGVVEAISADIEVDFERRLVSFVEQIEIKSIGSDPFGEDGDSGSLILDNETLAPVALLFAATRYGSIFANPIKPVLDYYDVTVVGEQGANA